MRGLLLRVSFLKLFIFLKTAIFTRGGAVRIAPRGTGVFIGNSRITAKACALGFDEKRSFIVLGFRTPKCLSGQIGLFGDGPDGAIKCALTRSRTFLRSSNSRRNISITGGGFAVAVGRKVARSII